MHTIYGTDSGQYAESTPIHVPGKLSGIKYGHFKYTMCL